MELYFAPLEGITDYIYRRIHRRYFPGVDKYFTPFLSPTQNHVFPPRELRQIVSENNADIPLVPQLLTKNVDDFLWAAKELADMGYEEVNLNAGCPSGTVTAKGKGAGLLADPDSLRRLLDGIFTGTPVRVSVKTRLGMREPEEFGRILQIYNDYPISQLIIHARTKKEMYEGRVYLDAFGEALAKSQAPVCYNGDVRTAADILAIDNRFPQAAAIMIGRGLVADPGLIAGMKGERTGKDALRRFHRELCEAYCEAFGGPASAIHRMKAIWSLMLGSFRGGEVYAKRLAKTRKWPEFQALTEEIFSALEMADEAPVSQFETHD